MRCRLHDPEHQARLDGSGKPNLAKEYFEDKAIREAEFVLDRIDKRWPEEVVLDREPTFARMDFSRGRAAVRIAGLKTSTGRQREPR
jgi:hypothetical protein